MPRATTCSLLTRQRHRCRGATTKGMSGWCAGCHSTYNEESSIYNAGDGFGLVDFATATRSTVELTNYDGPIDQRPHGHRHAAAGPRPAAKARTEPTRPVRLDRVPDVPPCTRYLGIMTGYAAEKSNIAGDEINDFITTGIDGEPSALLRNDNRGVCEACHNK